MHENQNGSKVENTGQVPAKPWVVEIKSKDATGWQVVGSWASRSQARKDAPSFRTEYGARNVRIRDARAAQV